MNIKRILVPVDFSTHAQRALDYAVELAKPFKAELSVLHVVEPVYYTAPDLAGAGAVSANLIEDLERSSRQQLQRLEARYAKKRVKLRAYLQTGAPAAAITDTAKRLKSDLIVMSTHGRTGLAHVLLGSVAEHVARTSPCPVLTIRRSAAKGGARKEPAKR